MTPQTRPPDFGINGTVGLQQDQYYWVRQSDGSRFIAKLERDAWWACGAGFPLDITRDQVICLVKPPEN